VGINIYFKTAVVLFISFVVRNEQTKSDSNFQIAITSSFKISQLDGLHLRY